MTANRWHDQDIEGLTVRSLRLEYDGRVVGTLVTLGRGFVFYTSDERIGGLDGRHFTSIATARAAVEAEMMNMQGHGSGGGRLAAGASAQAGSSPEGTGQGT